MIGPIALLRAGLQARDFLHSVRGQHGDYQFSSWPEPVRRRSAEPVRIGPTIARLRTVQRLTVGFLDPLEDAVFLMAALRGLAIDASFHLGRELVPAAAPAGLYAWVQCGDEVVSSSLPVREEYLELYQSEEGQGLCSV
jgi:hypothetical protein